MDLSLAKNIIYEDEDMVAINKPAGLLTHPTTRGDNKSQNPKSKIQNYRQNILTNWLIERYPEIKKVGDDPILRPGIVHRLDRDTSGVLIIAKNQKTFIYLKKLFQEHKIVKKYLGLVVGEVKDRNGEINKSIGRNYKEPTKRTTEGNMRGNIREAITYYKVLKKYAGFTLLEAIPKTGRTHQIRVHLKSIGHPIVCDQLYSGKLFVCPFDLKRQFLHASSIELTLPSDLRINLEADIPNDLKNVLKNLK